MQGLLRPRRYLTVVSDPSVTTTRKDRDKQLPDKVIEGHPSSTLVEDIESKGDGDGEEIHDVDAADVTDNGTMGDGAGEGVDNQKG